MPNTNHSEDVTCHDATPAVIYEDCPILEDTLRLMAEHDDRQLRRRIEARRSLERVEYLLRLRGERH